MLYEIRYWIGVNNIRQIQTAYVSGPEGRTEAVDPYSLPEGFRFAAESEATEEAKVLPVFGSR